VCGQRVVAWHMVGLLVARGWCAGARRAAMRMARRAGSTLGDVVARLLAAALPSETPVRLPPLIGRRPYPYWVFQARAAWADLLPQHTLFVQAAARIGRPSLHSCTPKPFTFPFSHAHAPRPCLLPNSDTKSVAAAEQVRPTYLLSLTIPHT